jgi:hypothetical protein
MRGGRYQDGLEGRVDKRSAQIHPAIGGLEHLLDEVADLSVVEDGRRQLGAALLGDEDTARLVDPVRFVGR